LRVSGLKSDSIVPDTGKPVAEKMAVVVIGTQVLFRDCLAKCLNEKNCFGVTFSSVSEWQKARAQQPAPAVIVLCSRANSTTEIEQDLSLLNRANVAVPVVLLSEAEDMEHVLVALDYGARGYIPTSVTLDVAVEALRLVGVGGTFIPVGCLRSTGPPLDEPDLAKNLANVFTARELEVLAALRQGKANKRLAYDLAMSESTVKVHIRNIMKKLKAKNRTEVAFLTRELFSATPLAGCPAMSGVTGPSPGLDFEVTLSRCTNGRIE
jgi:DNA-binding NarL/FixJ family response regulator